MSRTLEALGGDIFMTMMLAPFVVAARLPILMEAGSSLTASQELWLAGSEKAAAAVEGMIAYHGSMAVTAIRAGAAIGSGSFDPMRYADGHQRALGKAFRPISRRVRANARRLSRKVAG